VTLGEMFATFRRIILPSSSRLIRPKIKYVGEFDPHYRGSKKLRNTTNRRPIETAPYVNRTASTGARITEPQNSLCLVGLLAVRCKFLAVVVLR
jgi:hypothetical protein